MNHREKNYDAMTLEELQQEAREALLETDIIDGPMTEELEKIREALDRKRPVEYRYTPEESWARFLENHAEELEPYLGPPGKTGEGRRPRTGRALRRALIAAVIAVLLAGAVLAADSLGLWAWVPRWNAAAGRFEPARVETSGGSPILEALAHLGITELVYPPRLPEGFVLTESHISEDPLILVEQYARGKDRLSITVTPIDGFKTAVYQKSGKPVREYGEGETAHYMFENEGTITAIWYTKNYATFISGNLDLQEITQIIDSLYRTPEGGVLP